MAVKTGLTLSHYRLIEKIGEGGMGVVWKAEDTVLGRTVAIKVLPSDHARDEKRRKMFFDEARLASSLSEAHIVQVYEFGREGDLDFIVMEYVEGKPLNKVLHGRPIPLEKVVEIGYQVAFALSKAHRKGLLHRDLKPANILITTDGDAKVVDFGLATLFTPQETTIGTDGPTQSITKVSDEKKKRVAGTIPYMSPEQVRGEKLDPRSDIFSLGTVLYEVTTGKLPFRGATNQDVAAEIVKSRPKPVHEVVPKVPLDLERIITKALSSRRGDRYQNMADLVVDLKRLGRDLVSGSSPSYEELAKVVKPKRWWVGVVATAGIIVIAGIVWFVVSNLGTSVDPNTILIFPMEVRGQTEGAVYVGHVFAEAMAVNLAQGKGVNVLAVPEAAELGGGGAQNRARAARDLGAGRLLSGTLIREGDSVKAILSLVDATQNRVVWGTQEKATSGDLFYMASSLARAVAAELGATWGQLYDSPLNLTGGPSMTVSSDWIQALGALKHGDLESALEATERVVSDFPDELATWVIRATVLGNSWQIDRTAKKKKAYEKTLTTIKHLDPKSPYKKFFQTADFLLEGKPRKAITEFQNLLERNDLTTEFRFVIKTRIAWAKWQINDFAGALQDAEEALEYNSTKDETFLMLSFILRTMDRPDEALTRARQALYLNPYGSWNNMEMAETLSQLGRHNEALYYSVKMCEIAQDSIYCGAHANNLQRAGKVIEALAVARETATMPKSLSGSYNIAGYWALAGNKTEAFRFLRESLELGLASGFLTEDPTFEFLHGDPEFEAIIDEIERRIQAQSD